MASFSLFRGEVKTQFASWPKNQRCMRRKLVNGMFAEALKSPFFFLLEMHCGRATAKIVVEEGIY